MLYAIAMGQIIMCVQKAGKTSVLLVQCCRDNGPQLTDALQSNSSRHEAGQPPAAPRDAAAAAAAANKALSQLAVIVEHVVFELTDIMVLRVQCDITVYTREHQKGNLATANRRCINEIGC